MTNPEERMKILEKVERGQQSTAEAISSLYAEEPILPLSEKTAPATPMEVLESLEKGEINPDEAAEQLGSQKPKFQPWMESFEPVSSPSEEAMGRGTMWLLPLWGGIGLVLLSALWMSSRFENGGIDFWFFAAWLPLAFGILLISLAWASRRSPWLRLNLRSRSSEGIQRLNIRFPLPIGILAWTVDHFEDRITGVNVNNLREIVNADGFAGPLKDPIVIQVQDEDDGDEIEVILG